MAVKSIDLRVDVSAAVGRPAPLALSATLYLPGAGDPSPRAVMFAFPGAGYGRRYFDLSWPGFAGYSQAEHHVARGIAVVACDHLGVGDSDGDGGVPFTLAELGDANVAAVREIARRLETGTAAAGLSPLAALPLIGVGQSMGGAILLHMQARHGVFDAIAMLGSSAIQNVLPQPTPALTEQTREYYEAVATTGVRAAPTHAIDLLYPFHREDVPEALRAADFDGGYPVRLTAPPWGSVTVPSNGISVMAPGAVRSAAAAIDVPVLIAVGDRDTAPNPHAEPAAYPRSADVTLRIFPDMAHMHNFAGSRQLLWDDLIAWSVRCRLR